MGLFVLSLSVMLTAVSTLSVFVMWRLIRRADAMNAKTQGLYIQKMSECDSLAQKIARQDSVGLMDKPYEELMEFGFESGRDIDYGPISNPCRRGPVKKGGPHIPSLQKRGGPLDADQDELPIGFPDRFARQVADVLANENDIEQA